MTMSALDRLLAERACARLCADYARLVDSYDERWADLFTDDATLALHDVDLHGPDQIRAYVRQMDRDFVTRHLCTNIAIDVASGTEAHGAAELTYFLARGTGGVVRRPVLTPMAIGSYADIYRNTGAGWRIARRQFRAVFLRETVKA